MDNPLINMQFIEGEFTWKNLEQAIEEFTKVCSTRCRNILIDHKEIPPIFYFLFKETKSGIYKVSFLPVPFANNEEKHMYVFFVKKLMEAIPKDKFEVESVIFVSEAWLSIQKNTLDGDGKIDKDKLIMPSEDPENKDILMISVETKTYNQMFSYEVIRSGEGDVVLSPEPIGPSEKTDKMDGLFSNFLKTNI